MSSRRSGRQSTGSAHTAYIEEDTASESHSPESPASNSSGGLSSDWQNLSEGDIGPSDSASHSRKAPPVDRHSSRRSRYVPATDARPKDHRRKSSHRMPTIRDDDRLPLPSRSHSDHLRRRDHRDIDDGLNYGRQDPLASSRSASSSADSYDSSIGGGAPYDLPHHPHLPNVPYTNVPSFTHPNYPPTVLSGASGYEPTPHHIQSPFDALVPMQRHNMDPYGGAYAASHNHFGQRPSSSSNPFAPMTSGASALSSDYFPPPSPYDRPSTQHSHHQPHPYARPPGQPRPQSYAGPPYPGIEHAIAPYYQPQQTYGGYLPDPRVYELQQQHLELQRQLLESREAAKSPVRAKSKSPAPPPPPPEPPKEEVDHAARLITLLAEHEEKKRLAAEAKAKEEAMQAAAEKARQDAADAESAKIATLLKTWKDEAEKAAKEAMDKAEAERKVAEAAAARDAELAAAATAAREAAEKDAAEKSAAAEKEAAEKIKATEEETAKKLAEAKAASEALEKAKKELEDNLAKFAPQPDDTQGHVHFQDALGRKYDVPWRFAKTWKGMKTLIEQAFAHVDDIGQSVMDGRYDIVGPEGNIILPYVWDIVIQPDWAVVMELWPEPEPEPMPPGAFPPEVVVDPPKKRDSNKKKNGHKVKKTLINPAAMEHMRRQQDPMAPPPPPPPPPAPPAGGHHVVLDPDEIIFVEEGGGNHKANKPKKKPERAGFFASWIAASAGAKHKPAGKDDEKPGNMVHYDKSNNNSSGSGSSGRSHEHDDGFLLVDRNAKSVGQGKAIVTRGHDRTVTIEPACSVM